MSLHTAIVGAVGNAPTARLERGGILAHCGYETLVELPRKVLLANLNSGGYAP
jgi:hypothetical protein